MSLGGKSFYDETTPDSLYKVRLEGSKTSYKVVFRAVPDFIENRNVNYKSLDPVHMPGNILTYQNTSSRAFNISNIKIFSRTNKEAQDNLDLLNVLRAWTMPHFGQDVSGNGDEPAFGAPPEVLFLSAFAQSGGKRADTDFSKSGNLHRIPVVINQLSIPYPSDVDYINTETGDPFPTLMTIDLNLTETHSPTEYEEFSLSDYRAGTLKNF